MTQYALYPAQSNILDFPQKQKSNNEWYTSSLYVEAARAVMGGIDLDPASCEMANRTVKAARYYTKEDNGLAQEWGGRMWLNPPFGKTYNQSNQALFVRKLISEYETGNVEQAVLLITPKNTCSYFRPLWDFPICFADHHVQFHRPDGSMKDQMFGVCFVYLGSNIARFIELFSPFGRIARAIDTPRKPVAQPSLWEVRG